jgi:DNA-binding beta-propeller fold protein YncE
VILFFSRALIALCLICAGTAQAQTSGNERTPVMLPTSKVLTVPSPGRIASTNSFPATMVISPGGHYAALLNAGYGTQETQAHQSISVLNLDTNQIADFPDARLSSQAHQSYFIGLAFSSDGKRLYASVGSLTDPTGARPGDTGNGIAVYSFAAGKVAPLKFIPIPLEPLSSSKTLAVGLKAPPHMAIPYPAGMAVIADGGHDKLLVANNLSDNAVLLDAASGKVLETFDLSTNHLVPASYPYTCVATKDGRRAWCSLWNASEIVELDLTSGKVAGRRSVAGSPGQDQPPDPLAPGSHPTALILSPDEKVLYVTLSNADQVLALAVDTGFEAILSTHSSGQKFAGSHPIAMAISPGGLLFVANSSLNAVEVIDPSQQVAQPGRTVPVQKSRDPVLGFIPTDWYPSALAVHGDELLIATAKGQGAGPNNGEDKIVSARRHRDHPYIATVLRGSIARLNIAQILPKLPEYTQMVERDNLFPSDPGTIAFASGASPIKHVIYVLKENRTYDQILGDLKVGNGDPALTMYGEDITPNEHKLALEFGVLDNFYDSGEVSGDGHVWSTAAITSDYNEQTWQIAYRGKERTYDFQGQNAGEFPIDHNLPDVDDPMTGFLWDNLARNHVSFRIYGEFVNALWCNQNGAASTAKQGTPPELETECPRAYVEQGQILEPNVGDPHASASPWPWPVPLFSGVKPTKAALRDHFDPLYPDFNTDYPDQLRVDEFLNEFQAFVRARQENETPEFQMPSFVLLYLPDDHTGGTRPDHARPAANIADNDLALGRVVEAVSHSPYWDDTAIFVLEDDAQDGADHVDAHRSIAFVISKYSPGSAAQPNVEHRFYTTVNMIHTMETLLGLPPMNQNDAYAPLMSGLFSGPGDQAPYKADHRNLNNGLIYETNRHDAPGANISSRMDFSRPDRADAATLNRVLWQDRKGATPVPAPKHTVFAEGGD